MEGDERKIGIPLMADPSQQEAGPFDLKRLIQWVWLHARSEVRWLVMAMISAVGVSFLFSISLLYAREFINKVGQGYVSQTLIKLAGIIMAIFLGYSILKLISSTLGALASTNIRRNLEVSCFNHLSRLPFNYLEEKSHGRLTAALMAEIPMVSNVIQTILRSFVRAPITILIIIIILFYNSPLVAVVALLTMPLLFLGLSSFSSMAKRKTEQSFKSISHMYSRLGEHLGGIRVVRCLGLLDFYSNKMKDLSTDIARTSRHSAVISALQQTVQELISLVILISFLLWMAWKVYEGTMEIGHALLVPAAMLYIRSEGLVISDGYVRLRKTEGAAERLRELFQEKRESTGDQRLSDTIRRISLNDVSFRYPSGESVLENINLELQPGGLTVIIGESGAGKSTLCDLSLRLRARTHGNIFYNNVELENLHEEFVRDTTALVEQEPYLFEGTIRYNLQVASPSATEEQMWEALEMANAARFVRGLKGGLDSEAGQRGARLSVGQKQRICLSRALIKKPQFLVLDEFTNSVDLENESEIIDAVLKLSTRTIILCVTHRESIIMKAREVYHLQNKKLHKIEKHLKHIRLIKDTARPDSPKSGS